MRDFLVLHEADLTGGTFTVKLCSVALQCQGVRDQSSLQSRPCNCMWIHLSIVPCRWAAMVGDSHMMVFSGLRKVLTGLQQSVIINCPRPVSDQSLTSIANQSPTSGQQSVQIGGITKTCRRTVSDWLPIGSDLRAMVGDSRTISTDLLPTDCGPPVIRQVLHQLPIKIGVTATFLGGQCSSMVFGGRHLFWS